jgi:hypothetical protein
VVIFCAGATFSVMLLLLFGSGVSVVVVVVVVACVYPDRSDEVVYIVRN